MFGVSWTELLVVAVGALVLLGPKDMVIMAGKAGTWIRSLQMHWHDVKTQFHESMDRSGVYRDVKGFYRDVTPDSPLKPPASPKDEGPQP
jgi:Sec-independent protein translocase protein TatA